MSLIVDLPRSADLFVRLRELVEEGHPDGPVTVLREGRPSVTVRSLYRGALLRVQEVPSVRFVPWEPHPGSKVGPRVAALLAARAAARQARQQPCEQQEPAAAENAGAAAHLLPARRQSNAVLAG